MAINVLVVDDSGFFQKRIAEILKPVSDINIIGFASNGREAIEKNQSLNPDVITMDYEMPVMDGLTALRNIMNLKPTPVLMFSSLTYAGARITLDALDAGAVDFLPKNFGDLQHGGSKIRDLLTDKIKNVAKYYNRNASPEAYRVSSLKVEPDPPAAPKVAPVKTSAAKTSPPQSQVTPATKPVVNKGSSKNDTRLDQVDVVLIGTSTGGPVALQKVLTSLPANFPKPIMLIQHMPASFTGAFAERLDKLCRIKVKLAEDGDVLKPGVALLAPGGMQMMLDRSKVRIIEGDDRVNYRPCVDITFASAAKHFAAKALGIILTGMGSDGRDGAKLMKASGASIWAQDEKTCVIYGMPMAIAKANLANAILPLHDIGPLLSKEVGY
ncbi:chemotaxis response regulator protein-glutamate methylesterase [Bermanella sp. 47_1433_sub80_T6]|nr:chemotaxis response regulator protein-glutamate methylesterase [Bermanella sp. 47_1433_sub80_T6]